MPEKEMSVNSLALVNYDEDEKIINVSKHPSGKDIEAKKESQHGSKCFKVKSS